MPTAYHFHQIAKTHAIVTIKLSYYMLYLQFKSWNTNVSWSFHTVIFHKVHYLCCSLSLLLTTMLISNEGSIFSTFMTITYSNNIRTYNNCCIGLAQHIPMGSGSAQFDPTGLLTLVHENLAQLCVVLRLTYIFRRWAWISLAMGHDS